MRIFTMVITGSFILASTSFADLPYSDVSGALPNPVIALEANLQFPRVMNEARAALKTRDSSGFTGVGKSELIILGYSVKGNKVVIEVGAPTQMWPTHVYKTGEIQASFGFLPDGVNDIMIDGKITYVDQKQEIYPKDLK